MKAYTSAILCGACGCLMLAEQMVVDHRPQGPPQVRCINNECSQHDIGYYAPEAELKPVEAKVES